MSHYRRTEGQLGGREGERRREIFYKQKLKRSDQEFLGQSALNEPPY